MANYIKLRDVEGFHTLRAEAHNSFQTAGIELLEKAEIDLITDTPNTLRIGLRKGSIPDVYARNGNIVGVKVEGVTSETRADEGYTLVTLTKDQILFNFKINYKSLATVTPLNQ